MGRKKERVEEAVDLFPEKAGDSEKSLDQFEPLLARLEEIVAKLESGGLTLAESLRFFEEGAGCVDRLTAMLGDVREHVMKLVTDDEGGLNIEKFTGEEPS
jgi:exodeoxyribonuclease VII small subunit